MYPLSGFHLPTPLLAGGGTGIVVQTTLSSMTGTCMTSLLTTTRLDLSALEVVVTVAHHQDGGSPEIYFKLALLSHEHQVASGWTLRVPSLAHLQGSTPVADYPQFQVKPEGAAAVVVVGVASHLGRGSVPLYHAAETIVL